MPTRDEVLEELGLMPVFVPKKRPRTASAAISAQNVVIANAPTTNDSKSVEKASTAAAEVVKAIKVTKVTKAVKASPIAPQVALPPSLADASTIQTTQIAQIETAQTAVSVIDPHLAASQARREAHIAGLDWDGLVADIAQCSACSLCETRTNTVPGAGSQTASWLIVGEAPGEEEDKTGQAFVGRAGKLLDAMLRSVGRSRETNVYIANTLKCRPPGNRNPKAEELSACAPYLKRQIALMQPEMILTFGKFAITAITGVDEPVGTMRGRTFDYSGTPVRVTYHPAYLLRSPGEKAKAWEDLLSATKIFDKT